MLEWARTNRIHGGLVRVVGIRRCLVCLHLLVMIRKNGLIGFLYTGLQFDIKNLINVGMQELK